jgi:hypothetical protein
MHPRSHPFLVLLTAAVLAAGPRAQEKPAPDLGAAQATSVQRSAHGAAWVGDELWAAGADYKTLFRDGGFELHPALGRAAPRNLPLAFELESIERGGALVHAPDGPATPELGADGVVRYARGDAIVERYEPRADGLEQSFVFAAPLPGSGDLVVRGRIASELVAPLGEHAELGFTVPGLGGVRIGAVTGIDALGRTAAGSLRYDGATLELVLPGAFVDAAAYPLVLDPLIGAAFPIPGLGDRDEGWPDVAYDATNQLYLVVWHREFSVGDYDVHAQRVSTTGALVGGIVFIENAFNTVAFFPSVGSVRSAQRFFVAWQQLTDDGTWDVFARAVGASDGSTSSTVPVSTEATYADVCGTRWAAGGAFPIVVYKQQSSGIGSSTFVVPVTGDPTWISSGVVTADNRATKPSISKSIGGSGFAFVAYEFYTSPSNWDVHGALLNANGTKVAGPQALAESLDLEWEANVDGDGSSWLVAYQQAPSGSDYEIMCLRVDASSAPASFQVVATNALTQDSVGQYRPSVAWTPGKAFVAWSQVYSSGDLDVYALGVDPSDCSISEAALTLDYSPTWDAEPQLASQFSGGGTDDHVFATWYSGVLSGWTIEQSDIKAHLLEASGL